MITNGRSSARCEVEAIYLKDLPVQKMRNMRLRGTRPLARILHRAYKLTLSPLFGTACRFQPVCSDYALEAIEKYGWIRGAFMAIRRILRCNPWGCAGHDPVP